MNMVSGNLHEADVTDVCGWGEHVVVVLDMVQKTSHCLIWSHMNICYRFNNLLNLAVTTQ